MSARSSFLTCNASYYNPTFYIQSKELPNIFSIAVLIIKIPLAVNKQILLYVSLSVNSFWNLPKRHNRHAQSAKFWRARARASASERERAARSLARLKIKEEQLALARSRKNFIPSARSPALARVHFSKHQLASSSSSRASLGSSRADFDEFRLTKV